MKHTDWPAYYEVTAERPAWSTVVMASEAFGESPRTQPARAAVDLGCGAGRDARELLRRGWQVLAVDMEAAAIETLRALTPEVQRDRLTTEVSDLASFRIPACDLVNASLSLPYLPPDDFHTVWGRILAAISPEGRFAGMLFGDQDQSADESGMTCPPAATIRDYLKGFEIESWREWEEDGETALGEPHHFHNIEVVAVRGM